MIQSRGEWYVLNLRLSMYSLLCKELSFFLRYPYYFNIALAKPLISCLKTLYKGGASYTLVLISTMPDLRLTNEYYIAIYM